MSIYMKNRKKRKSNVIFFYILLFFFNFIFFLIFNKRNDLAEIQNLNNVLQDPDFIKHGKILRENYKSPKTPDFEQIPFSTDPIQIQKIK